MEKDFILKKIISQSGWKREDNRYDLPLDDKEVLTQKERVWYKGKFVIKELNIRVEDIKNIMLNTHQQQKLILKNWYEDKQ